MSIDEISAALSKRHFQNKADKEKKDSGSVSEGTQSKIDYWADRYKNAWIDSHPDGNFDDFHSNVLTTESRQAIPIDKQKQIISNDPRYEEMTNRDSVSITDNSSDVDNDNDQETGSLIPSWAKSSIENNPRYEEMKTGTSDSGMEKRNDDYVIPEDSFEKNILGTGKYIIENMLDGDALFLGEGPFNPDNWPILGSTDREKKERKDKEEYREEHPMNEELMTYVNGVPTLTEAGRKKYDDYHDSMGGLQQGYVTGLDEMMASLAATNAFDQYGNQVISDEDLAELSQYNFGNGLNKLANENYNDGTMREDSVKGRMISGEEYIKLNKMGFGGRPLEDIDPDKDYDQLGELRDYGFVPYITDEAQYNNWVASSIPDFITGSFNNLANTRDRYTDAIIRYKDNEYSRKDMNEELPKYFDVINGREDIDLKPFDSKFLLPDDPSVDRESDLPVTKVWTVNMAEGEEPFSISSPDFPQTEVLPDGQVAMYWPGNEDEVIYFESVADYNDNLPTYNYEPTTDESRVDGYITMPRLEYEQADGKQVSLSYGDVIDILQQMENGTADVDWGPFNIAKDAGYRKGFEKMVTTFDISDIVPNMADLLFGSAPLFFKQTAWPMALANAATAAAGLDARTYDPNDNSVRRLREGDIDGGDYALNIALSGLVPFTEKIAGGIGGSGGMIGRPLQNLLKKRGAPALSRYALDTAGEGLEEVIASTWEDAQVNGLKDLFANQVQKTDENGNPVFDENGEPEYVYDRTGHEVRDSNTSVEDRSSNFVKQVPETFLAGTALGGLFSTGKALGDYSSGTGYARDSAESKLLRKLEKAHNVKRYLDPKIGNSRVRISEEDIGTYGSKRDSE